MPRTRLMLDHHPAIGARLDQRHRGQPRPARARAAAVVAPPRAAAAGLPGSDRRRACNRGRGSGAMAAGRRLVAGRACRRPAAGTAAATQFAWMNSSCRPSYQMPANRCTRRRENAGGIASPIGTSFRKGIPVSPVSSELVKEFAPSGRLRAAINQGNSVLAQKGAERRGPGHHRGSRPRARPPARRAGRARHLRRRRQSVRRAQGRRPRHRLPGDRAGARRRRRFHRALCADRGHLRGAEGIPR